MRIDEELAAEAAASEVLSNNVKNAKTRRRFSQRRKGDGHHGALEGIVSNPPFR
jgi:hypothetical protein